MVEKPIVKHFRSGSSSLISRFCTEFGLVDTVNQMVTWDKKHWNVSPGQHVLALVINTLCGRDPLYRVEKFFCSHDTEVLFGEGVCAHDFNNDALGRTLDVLHAADPKKLLTAITLNQLLTEDMPLTFAHADTTSRSFYGAYEQEEQEDILQIRYGYSKDNHPDLKQIVIGMLTVHGGMPLFADIRNGNLDDKTWNKEMVSSIAATLTPEQTRKLVYVADSAFFTQENIQLAHMKELKFISLVSEKHRLRSEAIEAVLADPAMADVGVIAENGKGSRYRTQEITRTLNGVPLRLVVVHSSQLFEQKRTTFTKRLERERSGLENARDEFQKREFACAHDAGEAWKVWQQEHSKSWFPQQYTVVPHTRPAPRQGRGRPKKDEPVQMETVYSLQVDILPVPESVIADEETRMGYFVLATNVMDTASLPMVDVLREYKQQSTVEMRFKFLKDPQFVDALFLKTPERIEALGYVLLIALFLYMTLEKRLRLALKQRQIRIQPAPGYYTTRPTGRMVLQLINEMVSTTCWFDRQTNCWHRDVNFLDDQVKLIFDLLEFDLAYYTTVKSRL